MKILIALADIKACFWFARIHTDLTGAFGFQANDLYNLAMAMVFGSTTSASSWESFQQAIKALAIVFANRSDLVLQHKHFWTWFIGNDLDQTIDIVRAVSCKINKGIIVEAGTPVNLPTCIYVDDAIMLAPYVKHMKMVLAAMIKAIFIVMCNQKRCPPMPSGNGQMKRIGHQPVPNHSRSHNWHESTHGSNPCQVSGWNFEFTWLNPAHPLALV